MYWFKNVMTYRLTKELDWSLESLQEQQFKPCSEIDFSKFGWIPPVVTNENLYCEVNGYILLVAYREEKIIPAATVKKHLAERIKQLEEAQQRKLKKAEKQALKDDVMAKLITQAFSRYTHTALIIDTKKQFIYVDAASSKRAEDALALLRKSLGSLPVVPLIFNNDVSTVMTEWCSKGLPDWLDENEQLIELKGATNKIAKFKNQSIDDDIYQLIDTDCVITKLSLEWENHSSFVLNEDGTLKRLKFADNVLEHNDDIVKEDIEARFNADLLLMSDDISNLIDKLTNEFGGLRLVNYAK
ncbi:recombination-associated protein RdgC [Gallibacterium salpingitidis]|uniref:recombination-associated protein RdgC n=1 Tax=Gallibacterium salpingitidis TaxID=505341 RepID=UPI0026704E69|nr:recombination-associated protein RdgC [Gallibacterium salpingitidis]WKT00482.1 recombination-associated protein RdgC [Gallibacterium salpingitidis]